MTHQFGDPHQSVQRVYWNVSPTAIFGVVDQVRTKLVELVAQIRSDTGSVDDPSRDVVENAVNVVIHGKRSRVTVHAAQASGHASATVNPPTADDSPPWWRTTKAIWAFIVGAAGIAAAVFAYLQING